MERFWLAVVGFPFEWQHTVRATHGGSLVAWKAKTELRHPHEPSCVGSQARDAVVRSGCGEAEGTEVVARCGVPEGAGGGYK
jgi:hypothetical protein